jgi:hypothetical protein
MMAREGVPLLLSAELELVTLSHHDQFLFSTPRADLHAEAMAAGELSSLWVYQSARRLYLLYRHYFLV